MDKKIAIISATALGALLLGSVAFILRGSAYASACSASVVAGGAIGGPFTLVDESGVEVTDQDVIDAPSLIYFGYTFCPDFCPLDAQRNAVTSDILADQGLDLNTVFITIDPARDTPEVLAEYTDNFHPDMVGLTGSDEQIKAAANEYKVVYSRADDDPEFYLMNHSVFSYFVTPEDGFVDFFKNDDTPEAVAERIACHIG
ncbi:protein SCO1/2 [Cognatiyoonia sediminum]|uniref:Protein SCO1/2 n=1 Tax=Cognatiyoonia sediminum TaxID=1508389 RepID=A0A1M5QPQ6_9RHOB|nr:SCO family protein [Cognatiyoonia sediminum]SHH16074.1 protein SCO1/2 [Cognatiyoonia sediminum]